MFMRVHAVLCARKRAALTRAFLPAPHVHPPLAPRCECAPSLSFRSISLPVAPTLSPTAATPSLPGPSPRSISRPVPPHLHHASCPTHLHSPPFFDITVLKDEWGRHSWRCNPAVATEGAGSRGPEQFRAGRASRTHLSICFVFTRCKRSAASGQRRPRSSRCLPGQPSSDVCSTCVYKPDQEKSQAHCNPQRPLSTDQR